MKAYSIKSACLSLLIILMFVVSASAWEGKCVGIADGDTITVMHNGKGERIRLYGIDTPERRQDFGNRAKQFTSDMVFGKVVEVKSIDMDRYGRTVGLVYVGGQSLNEELIKAGYAWVYRKYCKQRFCSAWLTHEDEARRSGIGLWAHSNPIPPWDFRHSKRRSVTASATISPASGGYHGNVKSHVFHRSGCRYYNCKNCTAVFQSREEAIAAGYRPCKVCKP